MIVILATKRILSAEQMCITSTLFYTRFAGAFRTFKLRIFVRSNQDVFKSSSRDFIATTCIGKKKKVTLKEEA